MTKLKTWLDMERGRAAALAETLGVSPGRITQMADDGVPVKYMQRVFEFTNGEVTLASMVAERTPSEV
jgi:hypothetical protein